MIFGAIVGAEVVRFWRDQIAQKLGVHAFDALPEWP